MALDQTSTFAVLQPRLLGPELATPQQLGLTVSVELPAGYNFAGTVSMAALAVLTCIHYPMDNFSTTDVQDDNWALRRNNTGAVQVGVNDSRGDLVGYGKLQYKKDRGLLSDFVVHGGHRHQGIGRAIIDARLVVAQQLGLRMLIIPSLKPTNTLVSYYFQNGFTELDGGGFARSPDPQSAYWL